MKRKWLIITDRMDGLYRAALRRLTAAIAPYTASVLPVLSPDEIPTELPADAGLILLGTPKTGTTVTPYIEKGLLTLPEGEESYGIYVGEDPKEKESTRIVIAGRGERGVLYGCVDLCNRYLGEELFREKDLWREDLFDAPLDAPLPDWSVSVSPAIAHRGLWTWGHVIYDYRSYLENMLTLRMNELVIWNDRAPINAKEIVDHAHALGIRVLYGFSWGWGVDCKKLLFSFDAEEAERLKCSVLSTYEKEYASCGCDGIYFQSFTETTEESVAGKCIADTVTELVNDIGGTLLSRYPSLRLQFGLHATSVAPHLDAIQRVDPRIQIVWEDCGAFPYDYYPSHTTDFKKTLSLTEKLLVLRGEEERFGAVLKGMTKLDWTRFSHFDAPYLCGERSEAFLDERLAKKRKLWKLLQADWLENAEYARRTVAAVAKHGEHATLQALVEDGLFEREIPFPAALFAEMLWESETAVTRLIARVAKYPAITFANL